MTIKEETIKEISKEISLQEVINSINDNFQDYQKFVIESPKEKEVIGYIIKRNLPENQYLKQDIEPIYKGDE